jgi:hypothetical protein
MGNSGDPRFAPVLEKLRTDEDEIVADSAKWAATKISRSNASVAAPK